MLKKQIISLILALMCFSISFAMGTKSSAPSKVGSIAPDFELRGLNSQKVKLSDYKGKVVFLNFWATWCPPCREEMPSMQSLHQKMKGKQFEILAVLIESGAKASARQFIERGRFTFKILEDPDGVVARKYGIMSIPTTFIIDKQGKIIEKTVGARDWSKRSFDVR